MKTYEATIETELDGQLVEVEIHIQERRTPSYRDGSTWREYQARTKVYVWEQESVIENLINRRKRPTALYRTAAFRALAQLGHVDIADVKLYWSRTAGCSCGCSPAFILTDLERRGLVLQGENGRNADVSITIKAKVTEPASDEDVNRVASQVANLQVVTL
jgi:hypothetical protein